MEKVDSCCGLVGIYNIVEVEMFMKILDSKMVVVKVIEVIVIVIVNSGCLL